MTVLHIFCKFMSVVSFFARACISKRFFEKNAVRLWRNSLCALLIFLPVYSERHVMIGVPDAPGHWRIAGSYALVMGVEPSEGGGIALTIRIPRIGRAGGDTQKSGGESYLVLSAEGDSYAQALEHLQWTAARELNLSHLKLLIASEALAASEKFPKLIREIAETRHLYTTAGFIVCEGSARDFIEGQETILGTRLSSEISAMFRHYAAHGTIPRSTFAELYYATLSGLSDPTGIRGFLDDADQPPDTAQAAAIVGDDMRQGASTASSRQYLGTAVFRNGRLSRKLNAEDTLYLNLLTARLDSFTYAFNGRDYTLSCVKRPNRSVSIHPQGAKVSATLYLSCEDAAAPEALMGLEQDMARSLTDIIQRCQRMDLEPFGFAERAAAHFLTLGQWQEYDWRGQYVDAEVEVRVHIVGSGEA